MAMQLINELKVIKLPDIRENYIGKLLDFLPLDSEVLNCLYDFLKQETYIRVLTKGWQVYEQIDLSIRRTNID